MRVNAQVGGQRVAGVDLQRRVQRHFAGRCTKNAQTPCMGRHWARPAEGPTARRRPGGRGRFGQINHAVDQLAVTAVLDAGQVREHSACIGRIVGQLDPVDESAVKRYRQRRGPGAIRVRLRIILPVDPLRPVDAFTLGFGACLEQVVERLGMGLDDRGGSSIRYSKKPLPWP